MSKIFVVKNLLQIFQWTFLKCRVSWYLHFSCWKIQPSQCWPWQHCPALTTLLRKGLWPSS